MDWSRARCPNCENPMVINSAICRDCDIRLDATFDLSPLAELDEGDQVFVTEFLKCHGSIKRMEKVFGISYPTVKNRLSNIASKLTNADGGQLHVVATANVNRILERVRNQELSVDDAIRSLKR